MSIARTASGLLFSDNFNRANEDLKDDADWDGSAVLDLVSNEIKSDPNDTVGHEMCRVEIATIAQRGEMVVQCRGFFTDGGTFTTPRTIILMSSDLNRAFSFGLQIRRDNDTDPKVFLYYTNNGLPIVGIQEISTLTLLANTYYTMKLWVKDSLQRGYIDAVLRVSGTYAGNDAKIFSPGIARDTGGGIIGGKFSKFDDFFVYASNEVTMTGLPTGYQVKVGAESAVESGGTAVVDIAGVTCPAGRVDVLNAGGATLETFAPAGGVYGGDTYAYTTPPEPWVLDAEPAGSWLQD